MILVAARVSERDFTKGFVLEISEGHWVLPIEKPESTHQTTRKKTRKELEERPVQRKIWVVCGCTVAKRGLGAALDAAAEVLEENLAAVVVERRRKLRSETENIFRKREIRRSRRDLCWLPFSLPDYCPSRAILG